MLKKDTLGKVSSKSLEESFKCGECLHHSKHPHSAKGDVCSKLGIRAVGIAPKCFTPDFTQLLGNSDQFVMVAALFSIYTSKQKRILLGMLRSKSTKKHLDFGTKVYFRALGKDYLSNYLSGYVMGYTSSGELVISGSPEQKTRGKSFIFYMNDTESLLTHSEWKLKKRQLKEAGKILDPNSTIKIKKIDDYEPPTVDNAPKEWQDKQGKKKKKKKGVQSLNFKITG